MIIEIKSQNMIFFSKNDITHENVGNHLRKPNILFKNDFYDFFDAKLTFESLILNSLTIIISWKKISKIMKQIESDSVFNTLPTEFNNFVRTQQKKSYERT